MTKVLVVDDEPGVRAALQRALALERHDVVLAEDGQQALDALAEGAVDAIVLDVMMPRVDGWEMLRRMHERHGVGTIPVLMFSGKVDERSAAEAQERGAAAFIGKPFDPAQLIERTKQLLPLG